MDKQPQVEQVRDAGRALGAALMDTAPGRFLERFVEWMSDPVAVWIIFTAAMGMVAILAMMATAGRAM